MTRLDLFNLSQSFEKVNQQGAARLIADIANRDNFQVTPVAEGLYEALKHIADMLSYS